VAVAGGLAAGESLERLTVAPPDGAAPVSMTFSEVVAPPLIGLKTLRLCSAGGWSVNETDADEPLSVPVTVTRVEVVTAPT
jgi:hypothetical protein